jgi:hypothetical protein
MQLARYVYASEICTNGATVEADDDELSQNERTKCLEAELLYSSTSRSDATHHNALIVGSYAEVGNRKTTTFYLLHQSWLLAFVPRGFDSSKKHQRTPFTLVFKANSAAGTHWPHKRDVHTVTHVKPNSNT